MRTNKIRIAVVTSLILSGGQLGYSQGTFQNLGFESPITPLLRDGNFQVPITNALPRWSGYLNGGLVDRVDYNSFNLSGPSISLVDSQVFQPIQGGYSVYLKSFSDTGGTSAAIGQTGQIPSSSQSLFFIREPQSGFAVSFGGQNIPLVQFGTSGNNIIMAGNISMFAGQSGELRFLGTGLFDDIQFSNLPIPEPSAVGLFSLGALLLGWRCWRK